VDEQRVRDLVEHFYRGFLAADREGLVEVVAQKLPLPPRPGRVRGLLVALTVPSRPRLVPGT